MTDEELNEVYFHRYCLWNVGKTIRELHEILSMPKKMSHMVSKTGTLASSYNTTQGNKLFFLQVYKT